MFLLCAGLGLLLAPEQGGAGAPAAETESLMTLNWHLGALLLSLGSGAEGVYDILRPLYFEVGVLLVVAGDIRSSATAKRGVL
jgi:hypothetical protein